MTLSRRENAHRPAFTLVEVLVTIAVLIIVMGLMVSLARYVRRQASEQLTRDLLVKLDGLMKQYLAESNGKLPRVEAFIDPNQPDADEAIVRRAAWANSRDIVAALREMSEQSPDQPLFADAASSVYDSVTIRDAWGSEIVFMPRGHPLIGTALEDRPFFFSAGKDRLYLTQLDNIYSYEEIQLGRTE